MSEEILITGYEYPDLDAVACAYAYSEFLNKTGSNTVAVVFGKPHEEAQFVMKKAKIKISNGAKLISKNSKIILVDASDLSGISGKINPQNVIEIIDHRKVNDSDKFIKAKKQMEYVGSAATLIAEKFYKKKIEISKESALLLSSAIISNTINFKANVTTDRDTKAFAWLSKTVEIPKHFAWEMFKHKSSMEKPLADIFKTEFSQFEFAGKKMSVIQLEFMGVEKFVNEKLNEIKKNLKKLKSENKLDMIFLTCIDVKDAYNTFVVIDNQTERLIAEKMDVKFSNGAAKRQGIIMRKEMMPILKEAIEKDAKNPGAADTVNELLNLRRRK